MFYRLADWLMERALQGQPEFSQSEALAVLLLTWNRRYYTQRGRAFGRSDYDALDSVLEKHQAALATFRGRSITTFSERDEDAVRTLFSEFAPVVGWTGTAKALHLLAPRFFPIWDLEIAKKAYRLYQRSASNYLRLIEMTIKQVEALPPHLPFNPVKVIDEWNYCRITLKVL